MQATKSVQFEAEIRQVNSRTTASLDKEYKVVFVTNQVELMDLSTIAPDQTVKVTVELAG